jgi:hypothetical protein
MKYSNPNSNKGYKFFCCVEGCGRVRNGSSTYCADHQYPRYTGDHSPWRTGKYTNKMTEKQRANLPKFIKEAK